MLLLPQEILVYRSTLGIQQIHERLVTYVEPQINGFVGWKKKRQKQYEGTVDRNGFEITRIIGYRNSFLPVISGRIKATESQTVITITMRLHLFVRVFLTIWCGMAILFLVIYITKSIQERLFDPATLLPIALLIFMYSLTTRSFKMESKKAKEDLLEMLLATMNKG
jgi:hypothetical protein